MKKLLFSLGLVFMLLPGNTLFGQKRPLTIADADDWRTVQSTQIANDGKHVCFALKPQVGNVTQIIYAIETAQYDSIYRAPVARFSFYGSHLFATLTADHDSIRALKLEGVKKDKFPKNDLLVRNLRNGKDTIISRVKSWKHPDHNNHFLAYLLEKPISELEEDSLSTDSIETEEDGVLIRKKGGSKKVKKHGRSLVLLDLRTGKELNYPEVTHYNFSLNGALLYFKSDGDSLFEKGLYIVQTNELGLTRLTDSSMAVRSISSDTSGQQLAFLQRPDSLKKGNKHAYRIRIYDIQKEEFSMGLDSTTIPDSLTINQYAGPDFSKKGARLYFNLAKRGIQKEKDSTRLAEEEVKVDIWSYHDKRLQPEQKAEHKKDLASGYACFLNLKKGELTQLENDAIKRIVVSDRKSGRYALGYDSNPYEKERSWAYPWRRDLYLIDLKKDERQLIEKGFDGRSYLTPKGNYSLWYSRNDSSWYSLNNKNGEKLNLTKGLKTPFYQEDDDHPMLPSPYGYAGFISEEAAVIYDRYDLWLFELDGSGRKRLTQGREEGKRYRNYALDRQNPYLNFEKELILNCFHEGNKNSGLSRYDVATGKVISLMYGPALYSLEEFNWANKRLLYRKGDAENYPEIYLSSSDWEPGIKLSNTNPQQDSFIWFKASLHRYLNADGKWMSGILYTPENLDTSKSYPLIVYFYEQMSDYFHYYQAPRPSASTISRSFYPSNGYCVFVPDIVYQDGRPGDGAFKCIVPGVLSLLREHPYIDKERMALQGQSWGGYQSAYLITRTNLFACAMAGAPVSNMTSAYGGIRWGSGLNRAFQYERTQSRIGGSLWEKPLEYIENSPLFYADCVQTPLLIMHNDNDGAVPWYQGIEYFNALRRLDKKVWMLVYNNEQHNLMKRHNRVDLSHRMFGYFNHYLKGQEMPKWMKEGIPYIDKGKYMGY